MKKSIPPHTRLEQLLERLSTELAEATDAELLEACADLGIKPGMKGSLAFLGLKGAFSFPYVPEKLVPLPDPLPGPNLEDGPDLTRRQ
jgi:hypothetical protein